MPENNIPEGAVEEFFYTSHFPHRWSSGPTTHTFNLKTLAPFASLQEVKAAAEKDFVGGYHENSCVTTYGVRYVMKVGE